MVDKEQKKNQIHFNLDKMAPKYCTSMQVALLNNNNIVLTMVYNDAQTDNESTSNAVLIERVVIDLEHAGKLADILQSAVKTGKEEKKS